VIRSRSFTSCALAATLLAAACGPSKLGEGETTPTLPGDDPVPKGQAAAKPKTPAKPVAAADPWAGKKDLIQPPAARPPGKVALPPIERFELANGLKVIVVQSHQLPVVSFHLAVGAGQRDEPRDKRGLADVAAAMLTKGTKTRNAEQLAQAIDQVGGSLSAGVDLEATHITCEVLAKDLATCLDLLPDVTQNPTFSDKEIDEIRKQVVSAVKQRRDDAQVLAEDHFENLLWGDDHVRGWPVTLDSVSTIGRQDLIEWHGARFKPGNAVLVIAGDVDAKEMRAQTQKALGGWKKGAPPEAKKFPEPALKGVRVRLIDKPDQSQSVIKIGHLGVAHGEPDYLASVLMNYTLGGGALGTRLMKALSGPGGHAYRVTSQFERYKSRGGFQVTTATQTADTVAAVQLVLGELGKMQKDGPSVAELAAAKANLAGNYPLGFENAASIAAAVLAAELHGLGEDYVRDFPVRLAAVPLADVRAAAKNRLDAADVVVVIVGKADEIAPQLKKAGLAFELVDWLAPVSKRDREAQVAAHNAPPDAKKTADGRKLIDLAIAARGGAKKLAGVKELTATGKLSIFAQGGKAISGDYVRYFKAPDQQRTDISLPGKGTVKLVVSPKSAWVEFQSKVQEIPAESLAAINVLLFVDPERVLLHAQDKDMIVQAQGKQNVEGTDYDAVLERSADGAYEVTLLLDLKTHLVYRVVYSVQGETLFDEYGDYKDAGGVKVAHKVKTVNLLLQVPVEITYDKVEVNSGLPSGAFDRPAP
jgi:zinc protease